MTLDTFGLHAKVKSHPQGLGIFERVIGFDPKNAPGGGLSCAMLARKVNARPTTGLNRSAALVVWIYRIMHPVQTDPLDDLDPIVLGAVDKLVNSLMGGFTFGGAVRAVDIRGMAGQPLEVDLGYVEIDKKVFRIADVITPLIVNDVWSEVP